MSFTIDDWTSLAVTGVLALAVVRAPARDIVRVIRELRWWRRRD